MDSTVKKFVQSKLITKSPNIVEIGSHYGEDTLDFLRVFRDPNVYCFEPDPRNIATFHNHVLNKNVKLFEIAVSNEDDKEVDFYQSYRSEIKPKMFNKYDWIDKNEYIELKLNASGASSLKTGHPLVRDANVIKVKTIRMDTWVKANNIDCIDFMWIDVQGAEREVVEGFGEASNIIKYVWIECGETDYDGAMTRKQTIDVFNKINFRIVEKMSSKKGKGNLLFLRK